MTFLYTFLIMFAFWIMLSGRFDIFHLVLGVISSLMVAALSRDILFTDRTKKGRFPEAMRFLLYIPWLIYQIIVANIYVAYLALHPNMKELIDPKIVWFKSSLKDDVALVTLGNSITLTPGTITVRIVDGEFYVHALAPKFAEGIEETMGKRIARLFRENTDA